MKITHGKESPGCQRLFFLIAFGTRGKSRIVFLSLVHLAVAVILCGNIVFPVKARVVSSYLTNLHMRCSCKAG